MKNTVIRRHYVFYGEVQGVGFRWYAMKAAEAAGITGWVRNEYDGSVSMELQGTADQIEAVLEMLGKNRWAKITHKTETERSVIETERRFQIIP